MPGCAFVQITDHHLGESADELLRGYSTTHALRRVLAHVGEHAIDEVDFVVSTGDLVDRPTDAAYAHLRALLRSRAPAPGTPGHQLATIGGRADVPVYVLPGNHDDRDRFFAGTGAAPSARGLGHFAFDRAGTRFIGLDWGPAERAHGDAELFDFLAAQLDDGLPAVLFTHHQVVPTPVTWTDALIAPNVAELWRVVRGKPVLGVFSGHVHHTYETVVEGIPVFGLRATAPQLAPLDTPLLCLLPPHYRVVRVRDGVLTTQLHEVPL